MATRRFGGPKAPKKTYVDKGEAFNRYEEDPELQDEFTRKPTNASDVNITDFNTKVMKFDVFKEIKAQSDGFYETAAKSQHDSGYPTGSRAGGFCRQRNCNRRS